MNPNQINVESTHTDIYHFGGFIDEIINNEDQHIIVMIYDDDIINITVLKLYSSKVFAVQTLYT